MYQAETVMSILFSVVICTHNRADHLYRAVESAVGQDFEAGAYEVLVVDNASTDGTRSIVAGFRERHPNVLYIYEPALGLSNARNTGWRQARGRWVAYLDDDAVAAPDWLTGLHRTFVDEAIRPACVGGQILPNWEAPAPAWLHPSLHGHLTIIDWSREPQEVRKPHLVAGANIAFERAVLERVGGFNPALGRHGAKLLSGEEKEVVVKILRLGRPVWYQPAASVQHFVPAARLTRSWFLDRARWQGRSNGIIRLEELAGRPGARWRAVARETLRLRPWKSLLGCLLFVHRPHRQFQARFNVAVHSQCVWQLIVGMPAGERPVAPLREARHGP